MTLLQWFFFLIAKICQILSIFFEFKGNPDHITGAGGLKKKKNNNHKSFNKIWYFDNIALPLPKFVYIISSIKQTKKILRIKFLCQRIVCLQTMEIDNLFNSIFFFFFHYCFHIYVFDFLFTVNAIIELVKKIITKTHSIYQTVSRNRGCATLKVRWNFIKKNYIEMYKFQDLLNFYFRLTIINEIINDYTYELE